MAGITIKFPPYPETDIDHYNVYKYNSEATPPAYEKLGEVVQDAEEALLSYEDDDGVSSSLYKIASSSADQTEFLMSVVFSPGDLVGSARVFGRCLDTARNPIPLIKIEFNLSIPQAIRHGNILKRSTDVFSGSDGYWSIDLAPTSSLIPAGAKYWVQFDSGRGGNVALVEIPADAMLVYYPSLL